MVISGRARPSSVWITIFGALSSSIWPNPSPIGSAVVVVIVVTFLVIAMVEFCGEFVAAPVV